MSNRNRDRRRERQRKQRQRWPDPGNKKPAAGREHAGNALDLIVTHADETNRGRTHAA